jgi:hypothetical protein
MAIEEPQDVKEVTMTHEHKRRLLTWTGILAVGLAIAAPSASAQTAGTMSTTTSAQSPNSAGVLSTSRTSKGPATTATPDMINEAIQRSQARSANEKLNGTPQRFGSEEPFTYDPTK